MTRMSPSSKCIPAFRAESAIRLGRSSPRRISGNRGMRNSRKPEAAAEVSFEEEADLKGLAMGAEKEILREPGKAFTCREVSREKRTGGAPELGKRAARDNVNEPLNPFSGAVCRLFPCPSVYPTACLLDVPAASVAVVVVFAAASVVPGRVCSPVDRAAAVVFAGLVAAADPACAASVPAAAVVSAGSAAGCGRPQFSAEFSAVPAAVARSAAAPDLASGGAVPDPAELSAAPGLAFARSAAVPGPVSGGAARLPADASVRAAGSHFQAHCQDCLAAPKADGRCRFSDCRYSRADCPACCQVC